MLFTEKKVVISEPGFSNESFLGVLTKAEKKGWTGMLSIRNGDEEFGTIFLHGGFMAWAAGKYQSEDFGYYLETIGKIPKVRQQEIAQKCQNSRKSNELSFLFEESGLITRSTLRECLKSHITAAVNSLIDIPNTETIPRDCSLNVSPEFTFKLNEIIPDSAETGLLQKLPCTGDSGTPKENNAPQFETLHNALKGLSSLPGYQYSYVYDLHDKLVASHRAENYFCNLEETIDSSIIWILSSAAMMNDLFKSDIESVILEHDKGSFVIQWLDENKDYFVAAFFDKNGKPGVVKHKISETMPIIRKMARVKS